tara:strand:+ start:2476 stop:3873 length:1398 start_codon:yes stop_codon:yes gene_type:complete
MDSWTSIVLAAGKGSRMNSSLPKVLHKVAGLPLVLHAVCAVSSVHPKAPIVISSPDHAAQLSEILGPEYKCIDQPDPLGTGHALTIGLLAVEHDIHHVLVINADVPLVKPETVQELALLHESTGAKITFLIHASQNKPTQQVGVVARDSNEKIVKIIEFPDSTEVDLSKYEVNVGVYAFDVDWLRSVISDLEPRSKGEYNLTDLIEFASNRDERIECYETLDPSESLSVNTKKDLSEVESATQDRLRSFALESGAVLLDKASVYFDVTASVAADVIIHPNTQIRGVTVIDTGAVIGPNTRINDSIIGSDAIIEDSVLDSATLGNNVHVGPFSNLRPGTVLAENVYIGSHVEVKSSSIGSNTHVGHFSYIGDAVIGDHVNIGAGTVTCNFDGQEKHKTEIGNDVFIGSDSLLVAPVKIGIGAMTAAGAVVTKNVPANTRVAGVPAKPMAKSSSLKLLSKKEKDSLG